MSDTPTPQSASPAPEPPPAATVVSQGTIPEGDAGEILRLRQERDTLAAEKRARELRIMELEDQNRALTTPPAPKRKTLLEKAAEFFPSVE